MRIFRNLFKNIMCIYSALSGCFFVHAKDVKNEYATHLEQEQRNNDKTYSVTVY